MAKSDDLDLVHLFGLSLEETLGLGLDASGQPTDDDPVIDGLPARAIRDADAAEERDASAPTSLVAARAARDRARNAVQPAPARDDDDDMALIAMLDGLDAEDAEDADHYNGHDATRGLSLAATASPLPVQPPAPAGPATPPVAAHGEAGDGEGTDEDASGRFYVATDDGIDVASLFGLTDEEALGIGLSTEEAPALPLDVVLSAAASADGDEDGTPWREPVLPTMPLHVVHDASDAWTARDENLPLRAAHDGTDGATAAGRAPDLGGAKGRVPAFKRARHAGPRMIEEALPATSSEMPPIAASETGDVAATATPELQEAAMPLIAPLATASEPEEVMISAESGAWEQGDALVPDEPVGAFAVFSAPEQDTTDGMIDVTAVDPALLDAFAEESAELLDGIHEELERLEDDQADREALLETRRIIHTLKGGAKMCGFEHVVTLTHSCENLLDLVAEGTKDLDGPVLQSLFDGEPLLRATVQQALAGNMDAVAGLAELSARFDALCGFAPTEAIVAPDNAVPTPGEAEEPASVAAVDASAGDDRDDSDRFSADAEQAPLEEKSEESIVASDGEASEPAVAEPVAGPLPLVPPVVSIHEVETAREAGSQPASEGRSGRRGSNTINVDLAKVDAVAAKITEIAAHRVSSQGMVGQLMETTEDARRNVGRLHTLAVQLANKCASLQPEEVVRPDDELGLESFNALNTLILQLQEAVSDQQALVQAINDTITMHWRLKAVESKVDADIQSALMNIRLIPISNMRVRLDGVVRQAAQATGKAVRWQLQGGSVAVEKNVFDRLFEPLMHLLRNAIDHGIETAQARRESGKPESGAIAVSASQEGNQIVIAVSDDGAGIIPNKIAALAVDRGLITAEQAAGLNAQQKIALIFTPGFSTAGSVNHLSGRGVGMDVVREACLRMGGTIDVNARPGVGTTFTMRLPLSLSVTRGLIVRDGGCLMAIPVSQISALHLVPMSDVASAPQGRVARIEGQDLPIYNLPRLNGAAPSTYVQNGEVNVLQVAHEGGSIGIVIEDVLDEEEILIKAPPALLRAVNTILGAYVMPDGKVAPVINLPQMLAELRPVATLAPPSEDPDGQGLTALVVDDSMSMRVALTGTLQSAGFTVLTARDGQEALDLLKREGLPQLVMLDIEMPRMDGLETLFAIRQIPGGHELPVFMMTSRGGVRHRRAAEQLGCTRYFTKPYRDSELAAAAREVCAALSA